MPEHTDYGHVKLTDEQMKRLLEITGDCPACILTVLRRMESTHDSFDFKTAKKAWWEIHGKDMDNYIAQF